MEEQKFIDCSECKYSELCPCGWSLHNAACLTIQKEKELQLNQKYYLRFGDLPIDLISKAHKGDGIIKSEKGVSVWNCVFVNGVPFPIMSTQESESAFADYFYCLLGNKPVYLVTGTELKEKGSANEPLLSKDITIIKEYTNDYNYLKQILTKNQ